MAYKKTNWQDTLRDAQGNVIQKGTPLNAQALGKIEDGIVAAEQKIDNEISQVTTQLAQSNERVTNIEYANAKDKLNLFNYLGNTQNIHGKVLDMGANKWNGYRYWMAYTPYPQGDTKEENPCIAVSNDKINWQALSTMPLATAPANGYNNDTHLLYRADTNVMEIWWRAIDLQTNVRWWERRISSNGTTWSVAQRVWEVPDYDNDLVSPCVEYDVASRLYIAYAVHLATRTIQRITSPDPVTKVWSAPTIINMDKTECTPWHLDVIKTTIGREYLVQGYERGGGNNTSDLWWFVEKSNGELTKPVKVLQKSKSPDAFDDSGIYRSTFIKDSNGTYYVWYSAVSLDKSRSMALTYGKDMLSLNGYANSKKPIIGNSNRLTVNDEVIRDYDVRDIDTIYIQASNVQIQSLKNGYRNQRVTFVLYRSTASLIIKNSDHIATPSGLDYAADVNNQMTVELICTDATLNRWRLVGNVKHIISDNALIKAINHDIKSVVPNSSLLESGSWTGSSGTVSIANKELTYTVTTPIATARIENQWQSIVGHKYYVDYEILAKYPTETYAALGGATVSVATSFIPTANTWSRKPSIVTPNTEGILRIYHRTSINEYSYVKGDTIKYRNIIFIDLTATFGEGKEPNINEVQEILKYYKKDFLYGMSVSEMQMAIKALQSAT